MNSFCGGVRRAVLKKLSCCAMHVQSSSSWREACCLATPTNSHRFRTGACDVSVVGKDAIKQPTTMIISNNLCFGESEIKTEVSPSIHTALKATHTMVPFRLVAVILYERSHWEHSRIAHNQIRRTEICSNDRHSCHNWERECEP